MLRHGTRPDGETRILVAVALEDRAVRLTFLDDGIAFEYLRTPEGQNRLTVFVPIDATPAPKMSESAPPGG